MRLSFRARPVLAAMLAALLLGAIAHADEADDQYAVAAGHYAKKRWDLAAEAFQAFVEKHPGHTNAGQGVFFLGESLTQLGQWEQAAARFREYLEKQPAGPLAAAALFRLGEASYLTGKLDQAKLDLERFLAAYPDDKLNAYVLPYLGEIALAQQDFASAEERFRRGLSQFPQGAMQDQCRFGLARALEKRGGSEEAERYYLAVASKTASPLADDAQFRLGALQYASGRFEESIATLAALESLPGESPLRAPAQLGRGWALFKLGRVDEAKSAFQQLAADAKHGAEARYWLGLCEKAQGHWQPAARTLLDTARDYPGHELMPAVHFQAGDCLLSAGQLAEAAAEFDQAIASAPPDNPWLDDAMRGRVHVALLAKDYATLDRQAAEFNSRFPESPLKGDVQRMLARSLLERKDYAQAAAALEPLVAAGKDDQQALEGRYLLALAYEGLRREEDALNLLSPVAASADGVLLADAQLAQALMLMKLGRFAEAIKPLEALEESGQSHFSLRVPGGREKRQGFSDRSEFGPVGENPSVPCSALGNLAICYARTGQLDQARQRYDELLKRYADHELLPPITEQLADAAYAAGDVVWADRLFAWLAAEGRPPEYRRKGLSGLGWSQYKSGRLREAAETFQQLLSQDPEPALAAEAAFARGRILQELGETDAALAMYDLVITRYPEAKQYPEALWAAALLRDNLNQDQEAAVLYERLAEKGTDAFRQSSPDSDQAEKMPLPPVPPDALLYNWAWTLRDLGRQDQSARLMQRLRQEHPQSVYWADVTFRLAQRALENKDYAVSGRLVEEILARQPTPEIRHNTLYLKGQIAAAAGKWDEARTAFDALLGDNPEQSLRLLAEYGAAEAAFRQDDYQAAGEKLALLAAETEGLREPWLAAARLRWAQVLCHQKRWDEALEIASAIEAAYPDFAEQYEADYLIGRCLANRAEFERAREAYRKVIRSPQGAKTETAARAQLMIAESYYHQKNYQQALREYLSLEILYDYPQWQAAALLQAAKCYEMLGQWPEAVAEYLRLLADYAASPYAEEAKNRLEAAKRRLAAAPAS